MIGFTLNIGVACRHLGGLGGVGILSLKEVILFNTFNRLFLFSSLGVGIRKDESGLLEDSENTGEMGIFEGGVSGILDFFTETELLGVSGLLEDLEKTEEIGLLEFYHGPLFIIYNFLYKLTKFKRCRMIKNTKRAIK